MTAVHREYLSHARVIDRKLGLAVLDPAAAPVGTLRWARWRHGLQSIAPLRALVFSGYGEAASVCW
jgi:hypothetical protein